MTADIKQAEGYVQLLMQEGKLEEDIINETMALFQLEREQASRLVYEYKTSKQDLYKQNVSSNVRVRLIQTIPLILMATLYTFFYLDSKSLLFIPILILLVLAVLGVLSYCALLIYERLNVKSRLTPVSLGSHTPATNKPANYKGILIVFIIIAVVITFKYVTKSYLYSDKGIVKTERMVLGANCTSEYKTGKNGYQYYRFHFIGYKPEFRWPEYTHFKTFNFPQTPASSLKKGDTISVYIDLSSLQTEKDYAFIFDIELNGKRWLNQAKRNKLAEEKSKNELIAIYAILFVGLIVSIVQQKRKALHE
jgi:hypothetical protein